MKIILTNWINLLGVFLTSLAFLIVVALTDPNLSYNIFQAILAALFSVLAYGIMAWALFIVSLIVLDVILIVPNKKRLKTMLLIEWAISSCPFIYWATIYHEWVFMADVIVFFISQQVREKKIVV
jgi:hypothetical protein